MVGYTSSSFDDVVFTDERIKVGLKRGKSDHHALINAKITINFKFQLLDSYNKGKSHKQQECTFTSKF